MSHTVYLRDLIEPEANPFRFKFDSSKSGLNRFQLDKNATIFSNKYDATGKFISSPLFEEGDGRYPLFFDSSFRMKVDRYGYIIYDDNGNPVLERDKDGNPILVDDDYRRRLNKKILDHYYLYEIGYETPQMFKHQLNMKMREIMPYYNKLYEAYYYQLNRFVPPADIETIIQSGSIDHVAAQRILSDVADRYSYDQSGVKTTAENGVGPIHSRGKQFAFDTPQNLNSLDTDDPDHMSAATTVHNWQDGTLDRNGYFNDQGVKESPLALTGWNDAKSGNATVSVHNKDMTRQSGNETDTFNNSRTETKGKNSDVYNDKTDERKKFSTAQKYNALKEYVENVQNLDLLIIDELRPLFLYVY